MNYGRWYSFPFEPEPPPALFVVRAGKERAVHRSLERARAWARDHWFPSFLPGRAWFESRPLAAMLLRDARRGDTTAFLALLDLLEENGFDQEMLMNEAKKAGMHD